MERREKDLFDGTMLLAFVVVLIVDVVLLVESKYRSGSVGAYFFSGVIGWLCADLLSGVVHFLADRFGSEKTPIVGATLIGPFRHHHERPQAMAEHGFLEKNGNSALVAVLLLLWVPWVPLQSHFVWWAALLCTSVSLWVAGTNQIHAWAHQPERPRLVNLLQRWGVFISPQHHELHHQSATSTSGSRAQNAYYCITSGVFDRLLNSVVANRK